MKLVKDKFQEAWKSGHILGFIHREKAKQLLEGTDPFTFLFRFSESIVGSMSIDVKGYDRVKSCGPFKCFGKKIQTNPETPESVVENQTLSLNEFLSYIPVLERLYPNIRKDDAFPMPCNSQPSPRESTRMVHKYESIQIIFKINGI